MSGQWSVVRGQWAVARGRWLGKVRREKRSKLKLEL
jgi:hypothetical protein